MTFKQNHKKLFALLLMAVLFLCPVSVMAEDEPAAVSAEETTAAAESVLPQSEETALPEKTEEAAAVSAPETTAAPVPPTVTEAPAATAAPKANAAPAATSAPAAPFESGYAWAPADTRLYTGRSQSEDALLVQLPYSVYLYVKDCRGSWAELIVALRTEEGVQVTEAYVPLYHLELVPEKEQADAAASVFSKAHTDYHGITIRIVSLAERGAEPAPEIPAEVPVEESTEVPEADTPEVTDVPAEEIVGTPAEEPVEEPAEEPEAAAPEVPAEESVEESAEEPAQAPGADAPEADEVPAEEPVPEVSVSIRTHAASPVHIGDSVTLEAVTEGFDHEPVFFWEFRLPDGDKWYPYEGENGSKLTFFVNRYNSCYIWRVTAE